MVGISITARNSKLETINHNILIRAMKALLSKQTDHSTVKWDNVSGNVYFKSDRRDSANEIPHQPLPNMITDASGDWEWAPALW